MERRLQSEVSMNDQQSGNERPPTPDDSMTKKEKEAFEDQVEEFEGPDRREVRGKEDKRTHDPGISHS
jgi:hypothetical protein